MADPGTDHGKTDLRPLEISAVSGLLGLHHFPGEDDLLSRSGVVGRSFTRDDAYARSEQLDMYMDSEAKTLAVRQRGRGDASGYIQG